VLISLIFPEFQNSDPNKYVPEVKKTKLLFFSEQDFGQAITFYTQAIDLNSTEATFFGNRSFAYLKTECFGYALSDASAALDLDPKYVKVCYLTRIQ
jgi:serine/threonine-protein phosphatase 5